MHRWFTVYLRETMAEDGQEYNDGHIRLKTVGQHSQNRIVRRLYSDIWSDSLAKRPCPTILGQTAKLLPLDCLSLALRLIAIRIDPEDLDGFGALGVGGDEDV